MDPIVKKFTNSIKDCPIYWSSSCYDRNYTLQITHQYETDLMKVKISYKLDDINIYLYDNYPKFRNKKLIVSEIDFIIKYCTALELLIDALQNDEVFHLIIYHEHNRIEYKVKGDCFYVTIIEDYVVKQFREADYKMNKPIKLSFGKDLILPEFQKLYNDVSEYLDTCKLSDWENL